MRILITGANGFIGGYLVAHLLKGGHQVVCCVRAVRQTQLRFPLATVISCDFNRDTHISDWLPRLANIDVVINCAGVLTASRQQNIHHIHYQTPVALFKACEQLQIKRVLQISALGVVDGPEIDYVITKRKADEALLNMSVSACVLRPSLVYASGAYGGTSLLRALAALPYAIPLIGSGQFRFQPIAMFDLVRVIEHFLEQDYHGVIDVVGPKTATVKSILLSFRQWLGLPFAKTYAIPHWLIKLFVMFGNVFSSGPLNSVSYQMILKENMSDYKALRALLNFDLTPFPEGLNFYPSQTQDRWYARLYFLQPALTISLFLLWFFSGIIPLLTNQQAAEQLLHHLGFPSAMVSVVRVISCFWDVFLAIGMVMTRQKWFFGILQLLTIGAYTMVATVGAFGLWLDPLGPLLKNIPILVAVLIWMGMTDER
ncbi:SDR family oxidoreductase [Legionella oakridgensis]|uniref:SDR family oxidoreductase n=1 Tax=Legionella oakridgensis TaxID=29423 RepID=UPI0003DE44D8|nr:SDR family oxidoreductase [Legionella oakridgensis]ETO93373.1 nucleoside-diphosphate-sugar epimerase [Legionella oakridgensis RV-2-2007]